MMEIQELILRVPGLSEEEARLLGQEVAQELAHRFSPAQGGHYLARLDLKLSLPAGASRKQMAAAIILEIAGKLSESGLAGLKDYRDAP